MSLFADSPDKRNTVIPAIDDLRYLLVVARRRGLAFLVTYITEVLLFDLRHRTRTSTRVKKERQEPDPFLDSRRDGVLYVASFTRVISETVRLAEAALPETLRDREQFLDLGCGKGKALLVYALERTPQRSVSAIGIEYDGRLAEVARSNVRRCRLDGSITVVTGSASNFPAYTSAQCLIAYLYNPFHGPTFTSVLRSLAVFPHVLIYVDPVEQELLGEFGYSTHHTRVGRYGSESWVIASKDIPVSGDRAARGSADG